MAPDTRSKYPYHTVTYMAKRTDDSFASYKHQRLINGSVYVLHSTCEHITQGEQAHQDSVPFSSSTNFIPQVNVAMDNKADTLTQSQMLKDPDRAQFVASQVSEVNGLHKMEVFEVLHMLTKPPTAKLLNAIWSYRRKRSPVGTILKQKALLCVDGSQQLLGRDFWETYAPVMSWSTVHLMLLLSSLLGLKSRQVDYTQAFPQAPLEDPVYMRLPQGWFVDSKGRLTPHLDPTHNDTTHYIRLKRNLYGCRQAARNWFAYLTKGLLAHGFIQCSREPCLSSERIAL